MADLEPGDPSFRAWTISKGEWDGYGAASPRASWFGIAVSVLGVLFGILLFFGADIIEQFATSTAPSSIRWGFRTFGILFIAFLISFDIWARVMRRRSETLRPLVWESQGCVCPWCRVRVDAQPCARHGLSRVDQPTLLAYWEAGPRGAIADRARALEALRASARRQPIPQRLIAPFRRAFHASLIATNDPNATALQRLRASLPWIAVKIAVGAMLLAVAFLLVPRWALLGMIGGCWPYLIIGPALLLVGPMVRPGPPRCAACGQLCAGDRPSRCPECGADLTKPASIRRLERAPWTRMLIPPLLVAAVFPLIFAQDALIGVLPAPIRELLWTSFRPPSRYWDALDPATMTQAEVDAAARLLIACAVPDGPKPLLDFAFLARAAKAGKLTPITTEAAARAIVQATLEIEERDGRATAIVQPAFGAVILSHSGTPRLVSGGASIDDGPWSAPAEWSLFHDDLDDWWRVNGQLPALPVEQLEFRTDLGTLSPGTHTVRARCWIVLHDWRFVRYAPAFDEAGELIRPTGATVYDLVLEASFEAKTEATTAATIDSTSDSTSDAASDARRGSR